MFPWNIEDLGRIVVGRPLLPIFQEIMLENTGLKPSRATLQKLSACDTSLRPSTLRKFGIGFALKLFKSSVIQGLKPQARQYGQLFDGLTELLHCYADLPEAEPSIFFHRNLRDLFPQAINSMLWAEDWWISFCERGGSLKLNDVNGPTQSFPLGVMDHTPEEYKGEELRMRVGLLIEHHLFMLYLTAFEEDISQQTAEFSIPSPEHFLPVEDGETIHYPMWSFWRWFSEKAGCTTWGELAEKADFNQSDSEDGAEGDQVVRNWANAKPTGGSAENCKMISWKRLRQALLHVEGAESDPLSPFKMEVQWGYGIARVLQEHAARCLPTIVKFSSEAFPLQSFYQDRIELCKQNECRRIPALVAQL